MTIIRIQHQDIDFKKWDQTILTSATPFVFAQSFCLNATCPQWDALIIGDYESVFPLTHKTKFGFTYLPQPPFTSQLGAFGKVNLEIEQLFFKYITQHYKLIDIELNISNKIASEFITPKNTYILNYQSEYKFNQNTKRNINKAIDNGLIVERVEDKDVISLSQKYLNPFLENEVNLTKSTVALLDDLLKNSIESKTLFTFKVLDKNQTIKALGHFICNGKHALYLKGTNFDKADNSGSMHLLMKYAIEFFADKSTFFDFGGGSKQGLANFYMGFGGQVSTYSFLQVNRLPRLIKFIKNKK
ncbi:MAG: hypothetical protein C0448_12590 [Sphingobacteriaceae bacterium]|nr:hypothetical protein [Sphingobacteriaceae bacterium]